jgi:hypothetical protein
MEIITKVNIDKRKRYHYKIIGHSSIMVRKDIEKLQIILVTEVTQSHEVFRKNF